MLTAVLNGQIMAQPGPETGLLPRSKKLTIIVAVPFPATWLVMTTNYL